MTHPSLAEAARALARIIRTQFAPFCLALGRHEDGPNREQQPERDERFDKEVSEAFIDALRAALGAVPEERGECYRKPCGPEFCRGDEDCPRVTGIPDIAGGTAPHAK